MTLAFEENNERMMIGDSLGTIYEWKIEIRLDHITPNKIQIIKEKEIEGDPINCINILATNPRIIFVHSRDNCIR